MSLTVLPCGGFGALDPKGSTMRIVCELHIEWERGRQGDFVVDVIPRQGGGEERVFHSRKLPGCGAVTELDDAGVRRVTARAEALAEAAE